MKLAGAMPVLLSGRLKPGSSFFEAERGPGVLTANPTGNANEREFGFLPAN
jgi:hypothetical protein